jgi:hypothetical protein
MVSWAAAIPVAMTNVAAEAASIIVILLNMNSSSALSTMARSAPCYCRRQCIGQCGLWSSMVHR